MIEEYNTSVLAEIAMRVYDEKYFGNPEGKVIKFKLAEGMPPKEIEFEVIKNTPHSNTDQFGFNAFVLKEKNEDKYIVAFRGTDSALDFVSDVLAIGNKNLQTPIAIEFTKTLIEDSNIGANKDNILLVGHSLGGMLVNEVGVSLGVSGVAINSLGMKNIVNIGESSDGKKNKEKNSDKILNISFKNTNFMGGDFLSKIMTRKLKQSHIGKVLHLAGANTGFFGGHSIKSIVSAANDMDSIFEGKTDAEYSFKKEDIAAALDLNNKIDPKDAYRKMTSTLMRFVKGNPSAKMVGLDSLSFEKIVQKAREDNSYMHAVLSENGFVVENSNFFINPPSEVSDYELRSKARYIKESLSGKNNLLKKEETAISLKNISISQNDFFEIFGKDAPLSLKRSVSEAIIDSKVGGFGSEKKVLEEIGMHLKNNESIDILPLKLFSQNELYLMAKNDISFAYSLEKGNPFVIKGGDYSNFSPSLNDEELKKRSYDIFRKFNSVDIDEQDNSQQSIPSTLENDVLDRIIPSSEIFAKLLS